MHSMKLSFKCYENRYAIKDTTKGIGKSGREVGEMVPRAGVTNPAVAAPHPNKHYACGWFTSIVFV